MFKALPKSGFRLTQPQGPLTTVVIFRDRLSVRITFPHLYNRIGETMKYKKNDLVIVESKPSKTDRESGQRLADIKIGDVLIIIHEYSPSWDEKNQVWLRCTNEEHRSFLIRKDTVSLLQRRGGNVKQEDEVKNARFRADMQIRQLESVINGIKHDTNEQMRTDVFEDKTVNHYDEDYKESLI